MYEEIPKKKKNLPFPLILPVFYREQDMLLRSNAVMGYLFYFEASIATGKLCKIDENSDFLKKSQYCPQPIMKAERYDEEDNEKRKR